MVGSNYGNCHPGRLCINRMYMFYAIIYNSFSKLKAFFTFENLKSSSESHLWDRPAFLISCLLIYPAVLGIMNAQFGGSSVYSSHKVLVKRWNLHLQPYGMLKFGGTNQNVNPKCYLGNKLV